MKEHATDTVPASQAYRPSERTSGEWVVVLGSPDAPSPAVLIGFKTEKHAQEAADTLNGLEDDGGRADAVLGRMLAPSKHAKGFVGA